MGLYKVCSCGSDPSLSRRERRSGRRAAWSRCPHSWYYTFKLEGHPAIRKGTVFRDKKSASLELEEAKRRVRYGELGLAPPEAIALEAFGRQFLDTDVAVNAPRSLVRYESAHKRVCEKLGKRLLHTIQTEDVQRYKKQRMDDKADVATINRELAFLRRLFNVALQRKKVRHTPFRDENGQVAVRPLPVSVAAAHCPGGAAHRSEKDQYRDPAVGRPRF